jgi:hypothetical protein
VTALRSRFRVARKEEGTRKPEGDDRTPVGVPNGGRIWEVNRASGSDQVSVPCDPVILGVRRVTEVMSEAQECIGEGL